MSSAFERAARSDGCVVVEANAGCESARDGDGSKCMFVNDGAASSDEMQLVPSRSLKLQHGPEVQLSADALVAALEKYGQMHSSNVDTHALGYVSVRFYDLRDAIAAMKVREIDGHAITAEYAADRVARDLDEEGRVVVRVEGHLGSNELCHIFSTYGAVRNIQDVPNINIHKVVEFFDVRCAVKAVNALNAVDTDAMHAASVAYLEKTRCKLFLIPPRLPDAMGFDGEQQQQQYSKAPGAAMKTFPLGGATKPVVPTIDLHADPLSLSQTNNVWNAVEDTSKDSAMSRFFDSSSSLIGASEQFNISAMSQTASTAFGSSYGVVPDCTKATTFGDQSSSDSSAGLSLKEVLPSGLGLYDEDEEEEEGGENEVTQNVFSHHVVQPDSAAYQILSANRGSGWTPVLHHDNTFGSPGDESFDGFCPLPRSFLEHITGSPVSSHQGQNPYFISNEPKQDYAALTHYLDCLEQEAIFRQAVRLEVIKRLNALKSFDTAGEDSLEIPFQKYGGPSDWKTPSKTHHRKKGSKFPRRSSALDLEQETERRAQQEKMFAMDLERVRSGKDKRTTLMIKNIPNKYTQQMLLNRIEKEFKGTFDFFYLPIDFKNKCNVGYGFINMTSIEHIVPFVEHVHEQKWEKFNSDKVCCVTYARIQGRHALINHFQNSSLMLEDSKHQPLLFKPNGEPEPFPMKPANL